MDNYANNHCSSNSSSESLIGTTTSLASLTPTLVPHNISGNITAVTDPVQEATKAPAITHDCFDGISPLKNDQTNIVTVHD